MHTDRPRLRALAAALALGGVALLAAGCATGIPALTQDGYRKSAVDSEQLQVGRFWIERLPGQPATLVGVLIRRPVEGDLAGANLVVTLRDAAGRELATHRFAVAAGSIPESWGPHGGAASFRHALPDFPAATAEIVVRVTP